MTDRVLCAKCGADEVLSYHEASTAVCPSCCPDHDYIIDRYERYCANCGQEPPEDYYA